MKTVYNFSAGPAMLPNEVLMQAQTELLNYQHSGLSVLEIHHRSALFKTIIEQAESMLRELMNIPQNYHVLFLQGGASLQFTMVPLNFARNQKAFYINTGFWSKKAFAEAQKINDVTAEIIASSEDQNFTYIPVVEKKQIAQDAAYVHITTNNTIEGTTFYTLPVTGKVPLIADMSSNILSVDYNVADFDFIYASAQKNIGIAGLTIVIVRDDLMSKNDAISSMLNYQIHATNQSLYNTPPTYTIYIAKLMLEWIQANGGVAQMEKQNREKAIELYTTIEQSSLFSSSIFKTDRSYNTIPFTTGIEKLDVLFCKEAAIQGLKNLKGHRSIGGIRASLYNAFPKGGITALSNFMKEFEKQYGETSNRN